LGPYRSVETVGDQQAVRRVIRTVCKEGGFPKAWLGALAAWLGALAGPLPHLRRPTGGSVGVEEA